MARVVLNQVMRAIVEISGEPQIQQAGHVYWEDLETQGIFPDGPEAEFMCGWDLVVLVVCLGLDAEDVDVVLLHQGLEDGLLSGFFLGSNGHQLRVVNILDLGQVDLPQQLVFCYEIQDIQKFLLFRP